jgi:hypothetical protein
MPAQRRPGNVFDDDRRGPRGGQCIDVLARRGMVAGSIGAARRDRVPGSADRAMCSDVPAQRRPRDMFGSNAAPTEAFPTPAWMP